MGASTKSVVAGTPVSFSGSGSASASRLDRTWEEMELSSEEEGPNRESDRVVLPLGDDLEDSTETEG